MVILIFENYCFTVPLYNDELTKSDIVCEKPLQKEQPLRAEKSEYTSIIYNIAG